jgi:hypothetical protein
MPRLGKFSLLPLCLAVFAAQAAQAHIDLLSPKPLMSGHAMDEVALKAPPFGAPLVDAEAAPAQIAASGSEIDILLDVYKVHPGEIVVSYTQDLTGESAYPVYEIDNIRTPIPHTNVLLQAAAPCSPVDGCATAAAGAAQFKATVTLPDIEGDMILIVRQVMRDKMVIAEDDSVDLSQTYYHQAAKLHLVRDISITARAGE